jgi:hypothetical protein
MTSVVPLEKSKGYSRRFLVKPYRSFGSILIGFEKGVGFGLIAKWDEIKHQFFCIAMKFPEMLTEQLLMMNRGRFHSIHVVCPQRGSIHGLSLVRQPSIYGYKL